ncbi:hypothetical protein C2S51_008266, partial [Perilla frutescens var. frutescens]
KVASPSIVPSADLLIYEHGIIFVTEPRQLLAERVVLHGKTVVAQGLMLWDNLAGEGGLQSWEDLKWMPKLEGKSDPCGQGSRNEGHNVPDTVELQGIGDRVHKEGGKSSLDFKLGIDVLHKREQLNMGSGLAVEMDGSKC